MRHHALLGYLTGLPLFGAYFGLSLLLLAAFLLIYLRITPYHEIALIRAGNTAAATSLGGAIVGFVLPDARDPRLRSIEPEVPVFSKPLTALQMQKIVAMLTDGHSR